MSNHFKTYMEPVNTTPYYITPRAIKVIGVIGYAESGKDTFASIAKHSYGFTHLSFAYPMKQFMENAFGLTQYEVNHTQGKTAENSYWGMTNRKLLQLFGTEAMQPIFGKTVWCKCLQKDMHLKLNHGLQDKFVISDVRFPHEVEYILRELGGILVHVVRDGNNKLFSSERTHASEQTKSAVNMAPEFVHSPKVYVIRNVGTLDEYKRSCSNLMLDILNPPSPRLADVAAQYAVDNSNVEKR